MLSIYFLNVRRFLLFQRDLRILILVLKIEILGWGTPLEQRGCRNSVIHFLTLIIFHNWPYYYAYVFQRLQRGYVVSIAISELAPLPALNFFVPLSELNISKTLKLFVTRMERRPVHSLFGFDLVLGLFGLQERFEVLIGFRRCIELVARFFFFVSLTFVAEAVSNIIRCGKECFVTYYRTLILSLHLLEVLQTMRLR